MKNQRLSLADFKMTKMENANEIDKLIVGAAADCHPPLNSVSSNGTVVIKSYDPAGEAGSGAGYGNG